MSVSTLNSAFRLGFRVLDRTLEVLVMVCMLVLVLDVVWQVIGRYILERSGAWTAELATFMMMWVGLLGMSVALNHGAHLGIDVVTNMLPRIPRLVTEIFAYICAGAFSLFVLLIGGGMLVQRTLETRQMSPAMEVPMGYVYLALPVSGFFLILYSIRLSIRAIQAVRHPEIVDIPPASAAHSAMNVME